MFNVVMYKKKVVECRLVSSNFTIYSNSNVWYYGCFECAVFRASNN